MSRNQFSNAFSGESSTADRYFPKSYDGRNTVRKGHRAIRAANGARNAPSVDVVFT